MTDVPYSDSDIIGAIKSNLKDFLKKNNFTKKEHLYHLGLEKNSLVSGKLLRPTLVILGAQLAGKVNQLTLDLASSIELIHNFSLIHDDIEDKDVYRRGRKTLWALHGVPKATVLGDTMFGLAFNTLILQKYSHVNLKLRNLLANGCVRMIEGQSLDIAFESKKVITFDDYLEMIDNKTGELIKTSLLIGAYSTNPSSPKLFNSLSRFGTLFGRVFQIRDDVFGFFHSKELGKEPFGDLKQKKLSLPTIYMLNFAPQEVAHKFKKLYAEEQHDIEKLVTLVNSSNAKKWCQELALNFWHQALTALQPLSIDLSAKQKLINHGNSLVVSDW